MAPCPPPPDAPLLAPNDWRAVLDMLGDLADALASLHGEYYRAIGIDHAAALPLRVDREWLVGFVVDRQARDARRLPHDAGPQLRRVQSLTDREHEVLRWVAAGKTDRDIAAILAISHRTVHKHLQSAYAKLGVETRTAAVMRLVARTDTQSCPWAARPRAPTTVMRDVHARSAT